MKIYTVITSLIICASFQVNAETNNAEFLKKKNFGNFSFVGCTIEVDYPSGYIYSHIGGTYIKTQSDKVTVMINTEKFSQGMNNKNEFVKEYLYRQNYCSFVR